MGGFNPFKKVKKVARKLTKGVGDVVEKAIEKQNKKICRMRSMRSSRRKMKKQRGCIHRRGEVAHTGS